MSASELFGFLLCEKFPMTRLVQFALTQMVRRPSIPSIIAGTWKTCAGPMSFASFLSSVVLVPVF